MTGFINFFFIAASTTKPVTQIKARMPTTDVCRKHGLSQGTFYKIKSQYGGIEVSDAGKLRAVTDENAN